MEMSETAKAKAIDIAQKIHTGKKVIFGKYGIVEDIDIKRPPPGTGNAFAFVKYQNLDMAHRAKVNFS